MSRLSSTSGLRRSSRRIEEQPRPPQKTAMDSGRLLIDVAPSAGVRGRAGLRRRRGDDYAAREERLAKGEVGHEREPLERAPDRRPAAPTALASEVGDARFAHSRADFEELAGDVGGVVEPAGFEREAPQERAV